MTFGEKLSKLRKENNYTQEQLAHILNVSRQSVSKWESNITYPETDKLISMSRLFDCSIDFLLNDGYSNKPINENNLSFKSEYPLIHQKIIGYILLTFSLIAFILIVVLSDSEEELYITLHITIAVLLCSLICLFIKNKAGYWCTWAIVAPIILLSPHIVGLYLLNGINLIFICFYIIMFLVANKIFVDVKIYISIKKSVRIIFAWIILIALRVFSYFSVTSSIYNSTTSLSLYLLMNLVVYISLSMLLTYTVCYIKNLKKSTNKKTN